MTFRTVTFASLAAVAFAAPAFAHHSFAMFDQDKTVILRGVVKEFEWTSPHTWLRVTVTDPATGRPLQYAVEMGSPQRSTYDGWHKDTVKPGDPITVTIHPLKDGARGGMYLAAELPDGKKLGRTGPAVGLPTERPPPVR